MVTLRELHDDPAQMAAFFEWPYEDDEVLEYGYGDWPHTYQTEMRRKRTAAEATQERYRDLMRMVRSSEPRVLPQRHDLFVRECAREALGIKGRTAAEVRQKCIEQFPHLYQPPAPAILDQYGNRLNGPWSLADPEPVFAPPPASAVPDVPPAPRRLR